MDAFDLMGLGTATTATAVTAIAFALAVLRVPHARHPRLAQAVALLLVSTLVLVTAALWINRATGTVSSWEFLAEGPGELSVQAQEGAPAHREDGGDSRAKLAALEAAQAAPVTSLQRDPLHDDALTGLRGTAHGQWITVAIPAPGIATTEVMVHLPAGYVQNPDRRYPVIVALSGIPGGPGTFRHAFRLGRDMDRAASHGELSETIVVAPTPYPGTYDTECVDAAPGTDPSARGSDGQYETYLAEVVPDWIRTHLRAVEHPEAWATYGYSAGGWCANMLALRHPELFASAIALAGYYLPLYASGQQWRPADDPRYDLPALAADTAPAVRLWFFYGADDPLPHPSLATMQEAVRAPTSLTVSSTPRGGHAVSLWVEVTPAALRWLGSTSPGFAPARNP